MKVAMVSTHAGADGDGRHVHVAGLAAALGELGADVTVYTRRDDAAVPALVHAAPRVVVEHVDAGPPAPVPEGDLFPFMGMFAGQLRRRWAHERPDVVHAHGWPAGKASLAAGWPLAVPVAQTFHALGAVQRRHLGGTQPSPPEREEVERAVLRRCDHVFAACSGELFELLRLGGDARRISIVPGGVDLSAFRPDGPAEPRRPGLRRLLMVGGLVEHRGVDDAVAALAHIPDAELVVAGGPARVDLAAQAEAAGVADRVHFRGCDGRADLPALYRSADAVVCVPWYEPFGIAALEAMACGVPVIASAVGGLVDAVVDGVTGVHVPPRSPGAVAQAAQVLLADEGRRLALGRAGAHRAAARYGWRRAAASTLATYAALQEAALAGTGPGRY